MRSSLKGLVPEPARDAVRGTYWAFRRWYERTPQEIALRRLRGDHGAVVPMGPFQGMRCLATIKDGCIIPKLIGSYEEEIHSWIEELIERQPRRVIDVGCASGWYTTGFALRLPDSEVYGYDVDEEALDRARQLADMNSVAERVDLRLERLTPTTLGEAIVPGDTVIVVDIDGPELDLLDPAVDERLLGADYLVELHDCFNPIISSTVVGRFEETHIIRRTYALGREPSHYPELARFRSRWGTRGRRRRAPAGEPEAGVRTDAAP